MPSFFFRKLQLITVLLLIRDSYVSWSTRLVSLNVWVGLSIFDSVSSFIKAYYWHVSKISLKISFILLFDINSPTLSFQNLLHTSVEIHSLLVTRCKITQYSLRNSLVTCCRSCLLQKITRYSLQKLFLVKNHSLLVAKFDR